VVLKGRKLGVRMEDRKEILEGENLLFRGIYIFSKNRKIGENIAFRKNIRGKFERNSDRLIFF